MKHYDRFFKSAQAKVKENASAIAEKNLAEKKKMAEIPINHFIYVIFLLPLFVVSAIILIFVSTVEINSDETEITTVPDTILIVDTIPRLGIGYTELLRSNYLLNVAEQTISVPVYASVREDGIVGAVIDVFTDVTAEQYACMDVVVKAGIETREIQILTDSIFFNPDKSIAEMVVVLPTPRVNTFYIDYTSMRFHFNEGHVLNTAENTLAFIERATDEILPSGVEEALNRGILEEARTASARQVIEILRSVGVGEVRVIYRDSENYIALTNSALVRGE